MNHRAYAKALLRLSRSGTHSDTLVSRLVAHLKDRGRVKLLPRILGECSELMHKQKARTAVVEIASEKEKASALAAAALSGIETHATHVNHALIRGWRARKNGVLIDASAKRSLVELYKNSIQ